MMGTQLRDEVKYEITVNNAMLDQSHKKQVAATRTGCWQQSPPSAARARRYPPSTVQVQMLSRHLLHRFGKYAHGFFCVKASKRINDSDLLIPTPDPSLCSIAAHNVGFGRNASVSRG
ncbi:MAG TPA: hypothetical protein ACQGQH_09145 [Xylella sp.]